MRVSLIDSLLGAIVRLDGDSLVLHTGEKPYVVTSSSAMNAFRGPLAWGQVELSTRSLTPEALSGMLDQLLSADQRRLLDEFGAIENELPAHGDRPAFTVIAARGGDDIWVEIKPVEKEEVSQGSRVPQVPKVPQVPQVQVPSLEIVPDVQQEHPDEDDVAKLLAFSGLLQASTPAILSEEEIPAVGPAAEAHAEDDEEPALVEIRVGKRPLEETPPEEIALEETALEPEPHEEQAPAVVLPLARTPRQPEAVAAVPPSDVERLLRIAVARGASGLYLIAQSRPTLRVDGEMQPLDGEDALTVASVEALTLALAPESTRDTVRNGETAEWFREIEDLGRVRCLSFHDHRGPGVIVRMLPGRAISAEQLGLSKDVQALCAQPDGLVLVSGPRASGKSTLLGALVDLVNRTRADHVITVEQHIRFLHEGRRSVVSQREVRGDANDVLMAVRAALREDPDVLVVEELRSPEVTSACLEAAEAGRLVLAGLRAPASAQAVERLAGQFPVERRADALSGLSRSLRGVVSQVLLRKRSGGLLAARELLLNTPAVASVIADGKLFQLSAALESGRKMGSVPLNDMLATLVRDGTVDPGEAWLRAYDRDGLLTLLKRDGVDTSFAERLA